jgi:hypothetical protein
MQNPVDLHMSIYNDHDNHCTYSNITLPDQYRGYPGVVHGGIVAIMLDEISVRATIVDGNDQNLMVTMKLEVKYRLPRPRKRRRKQWAASSRRRTRAPKWQARFNCPTAC